MSHTHILKHKTGNSKCIVFLQFQKIRIQKNRNRFTHHEIFFSYGKFFLKIFFVGMKKFPSEGRVTSKILRDIFRRIDYDYR